MLTTERLEEMRQAELRVVQYPLTQQRVKAAAHGAQNGSAIKQPICLLWR